MDLLGFFPPDATARGAVLVAGGALLGGLARWLLSAWLPGDFPWGTTLVNVAGSFAIGFLMFGGQAAGPLGPDARLFVGVGFLGAFTTMSAFALSTISFLEEGRFALAALAVVGNPVLSLAAAWLGRSAGLAWGAP